MITEVCRFCGGTDKKTLGVNAVTKEAITSLKDSFGHQHLVQTPLLNRNVSHADDVAAAKAMLDRNEQAFIAELQDQFHYSDPQIESLRVALKACECNFAS
jgi:hypothetical protein